MAILIRLHEGGEDVTEELEYVPGRFIVNRSFIARIGSMLKKGEVDGCEVGKKQERLRHTPISPVLPRKQGINARHLNFQRIIPAGAVEPLQCPRRASDTRVYPRGCGGAPGVSIFDHIAAGLSPRVRGSPT